MEGKERERVMREKRVYEASLSGNVDSLNMLVKEDKLILARLSLTCFNETPLHVAAMLGHVEFAKALLSHKRDLVTELDSRGRSPLHLASANGYVEIVKILLLVDSSLCLVRDEDGRTPLHLAAMKGRVDIVNELAQVHQEVIQYCTLDPEKTILHLCVMHNRLEALKRLIELSTTFNDFVNVKDENDNTILHTATALKQMQTIKYLVSKTRVRVNAVNGNGFTALDIINHSPKDLKAVEIRELLIAAGTLRARVVPASERDNVKPQDIISCSTEGERDQISRAQQEHHEAPVPLPPSSSVGSSLIKKQDTNWLEKMRDSLMIAATVIAAMAYQAALNPPGGVWQEDKEEVENTHKMLYHAGKSVMARNSSFWYQSFWGCNTASFVASLSTMFLLISGIPLKKRCTMWLLMAVMWVTIMFMALTYLVSMLAIAPDHEVQTMAKVIVLSVLFWLGLIAIVFIVHTCRFIIWIVRKYRKMIRSRRKVNEGARQNESTTV